MANEKTISEIYPSETDPDDWCMRDGNELLGTFTFPLTDAAGDYVKTDADVIREAERVTGRQYVGSPKL